MTTYNSAKYGSVEAGGVENKLINGDFSIAQRNMGAAITSTTSFNNNDTSYTFLLHRETGVQLSHQQPLTFPLMTLLTL